MNNPHFDLAFYAKPIHLSISRTGEIRTRCDSNRPATPGSRLTRYPSLVTCEACRANFTEKERDNADAGETIRSTED